MHGVALHGPLKKKKSGEKNKIGPWPPGGRFLGSLENIRRRSVRVAELHRGFILTKKGDINPPKKSETPHGPLGGGLLVVFFENFKSCPMVPKLWL
jgi:hypothetical protein